MKKLFVISIFFLFASVSYSQYKGLGLGIIIGEPTGISLKAWLDRNTAIDGAIGWSFADDNALHIHGDYLIHNFTLITVQNGKVPFYYGVGARIKTSEDVILGIRVPVGLSYIFNEAPVDMFLEVVPVLDVVPKTNFRLNAAIGGRFYLDW